MILVTGGTGLVGSHLLVKLLQENEVVKAIYRTKESLEAVKNVFGYYQKEILFEKIIWVEADINDIPSLNLAFEGVSKVYHCAAFISFDPKDEKLIRKINIEGTANIVNCCIDFKIQKLCYVSSIAALGDTKENETIITEETEWNPEKLHGDYALSKYGAELEVWRGFQEGLEIVIVNPGVIFGFGFPDKGSNTVLNAIKKGNPFYTKGKLGIVAVEDVVNCMVLLMSGNFNGERYTLVAENLNLEEFLNFISDTFQVKRPFIYANKTLTRIAWRLDWFLSKIMGKKRSFTRSTAKASHSVDIYDNAKIKIALSYEFVDMKDYLKKLLVL